MKIPARSLYIHIPFCKAKCAYCDFFSVSAEAVSDRYIDALIAEIQYHMVEGNLGILDTVYIGGGTPSLLSAPQLVRIMDTVLPLCCKDADHIPEITIEVNPESITDSFPETAQASGINRISIGVQALNDDVLRCVCRRCTREKTLSALAVLNKSGIRFSADMIAGLPGQNDTLFLAGLEELFSYDPEHISLYALTVEESTPLYRQIQSGIISHSEEITDSQWIAGRILLEKAGYAQYEVSNFAKPLCCSRHNMSYWKQHSYIGVGAGASGTLYISESQSVLSVPLSSALRYTNSTDIPLYTDFWIQAGNPLSGTPVPDGIPVNREQLDIGTLAFEFCMLGLRLREGIDPAEYKAKFNSDLNTAVFEKWRSKGAVLIRHHADGSMRYALSEDGILFLNIFLEELLE